MLQQILNSQDPIILLNESSLFPKFEVTVCASERYFGWYQLK